jgi:HlyD family secretion protein
MKRVFSILLILLVVMIIGGSFMYLFKKSQAKPVLYQTETAEITDIVKKTVATGSIVPRQSVDVKPKVTGVLTELYFRDPGAKVTQGTAIAKITIIPDAQVVNQAEASVRSAQISYDNAKREMERNEALFKQGVVSEAELFSFRTAFALAKQQLDAGGSNLQLVKEGATRSQGKLSSLIVTATTDGTIIDVPVKVGYSVIQANSFNPGTTIATIANMDDMIFDGRVDEAEVAKIAKDNKLKIKVGAIEKDMFEGKLEYIAPQGKELDGAIQFEIKASVTQKPGIYIRAGYSANADIVLDERKQVLAIREALVQYDGTKPFVEVETMPQTFVRKDVTLGLSDAIKIEVLSGVTKTDKIKIPDNAGPANMAGSGSGSGAGSNKPPPPPKK